MVARIAQEEIRDSETFELIEAQIIECECKAHIQLWDSWANGCETCGREYNGSGQEIQRDWYHKIDNKKILSVPSGVISARIDPDLHMPDVNRSNNGTQKGFKINFF